MKILVADDHPLYRGALKNLLLQLEEHVTVIEIDNFDQLSDIAGHNDNDFDLILLDIHMPGSSFKDAVTLLRNEHPTIPVVIISASDSTVDVRNSLEFGAQGYIPKSSSSAVMLSALRLVLSGGVYVPPVVLSETMFPAPAQSGDVGNPNSINSEASALTARQKNVLSLMAEGLTNRDIAKNLDLAESTVKVHVTAILKTLKVNNRTQAVIGASQYLSDLADEEQN